MAAIASSPDLLGSVVEAGAITTLVAPVDDELAALTAAAAVSWRTGEPLLPGLVPTGPGEVSLYVFGSQLIGWKCLMADICAAARIACPTTYLRCPTTPLVRPLPEPRDAEGYEFWQRIAEADVEADLRAAKDAGRSFTPLLTIVFDVDRAAGGAAARRQLYEMYRGRTVLMAGVEAGDEAAEYGPVIELPNLHDSLRWRDLLAAVTGGDTPQLAYTPEEPASTPVITRDPDIPEMLGAVRAFFVVEGAEAMRDLLSDRASTATHELKARAQAQGISPGRLWRAARWLERDAPSPTKGGFGTLIGYGAVFNQWKEVDDALEGHYLLRVAPGAFTNTIAESSGRVKCTVSHGHEPEFDYRSLGPVTRLEQDEHGLYYEVELLDSDDTRRLLPGLKAGLYRSSFTYDVLDEHLVKQPNPLDHNPGAIPELTLLEVRCSELGPCRSPAFKGTAAGIRL